MYPTSFHNQNDQLKGLLGLIFSRQLAFKAFGCAEKGRRAPTPTWTPTRTTMRVSLFVLVAIVFLADDSSVNAQAPSISSFRSPSYPPTPAPTNRNWGDNSMFFLLTWCVNQRQSCRTIFSSLMARCSTRKQVHPRLEINLLFLFTPGLLWQLFLR